MKKRRKKERMKKRRKTEVFCVARLPFGSPDEWLFFHCEIGIQI